MAVEMTTKFGLCLRVVGSHLHRVCNVQMMFVLLYVSLLRSSLVLGVRDDGMPCDWTPRFM